MVGVRVYQTWNLAAGLMQKYPLLGRERNHVSPPS